MGLTTPPNQIQKDSISQELRYSLWNWLDESIPIEDWRKVVIEFVRNYLRGPVDQVPPSEHQCREMIRSAIIDAKEWYGCYNVLQEVIRIARRNPLRMLLMGQGIRGKHFGHVSQ